MLQPIYHVVSTFYPVSASAGTIAKGQLVGLNSSGEAVAYDRSVATQVPVGLAGEVKGTLTPGIFTNRVSDYGDQTYGSGQMTVYSNGGEFYVDINAGDSDTSFPAGEVVSDGTVSVGDKLTPHSVAGQLVVNGSAEPYSGTAANVLIAIVTDDLANSDFKIPTGIPNEFEPAGDSDNPRKFARIKLVI